MQKILRDGEARIIIFYELKTIFLYAFCKFAEGIFENLLSNFSNHSQICRVN